MTGREKCIAGYRRLIFLCVAAILTCLLSVTRAEAASSPGQKKILVIYHDIGWAAPANRMMFMGMRNFFDGHGENGITMYSENLDLSLLRNKADEEALAQFYRHKYAHEAIDVLVPVQGPALQFLIKYRAFLFPGVPIVYIAPVALNPPLEKMADLTGITLSLDIRGTIDLMRKIHPGLKNVALVAGTGRIEQNIASLARGTLQKDFPAMHVIDLAGFPMDGILKHVGRLPKSTAVLFLPLYQDGAGKRFVPAEALQAVSRAANAPVYCLFDSHLGYGCVGGCMTSYETLGARAGQMVLRVLRGESPGSMKPEVMGSAGAIFDWRAMKRWGIPLKALPEESIIRYRETTLWERARWYIIGTVLFAVAETILIAVLLLSIRMRKRAQKELRQSELRYRTIADFTDDWEYWVDPGGVFVYISPSCERVTGFTQDEFLRDPGLRKAIVMPEDQGIWENHLSERSGKSGISSIHFRIRRKDGQVRWIDHTCVPVRDASGAFLGYRASNRDITSRTLAEEALEKSRSDLEQEIARRKAAQEALAASETDLKRAQEVALIGSWKLDVASGALSWSEGVHLIFGIPEGADLSFNVVLDMIHPDDREHARTSWYAALKGEPYDTEFRIIVGRGVKWVRHKAEIDFGQDGTPIRATGIVQDITRRKLAEENQHKLRQSLSHVSRLSTVGELTTTMAHEINQPLAAILANAQAARHMIDEDEPDLAELRETLDDIICDDKRAREVVLRIRGLMKKENVPFEHMDVSGFVRETLKLVEKEAVIRNIRIKVEHDPRTPQVIADRVQLQQVLINLLINAMESMGDGGTSRSITVRSFPDESGHAVISVEDTGKGIGQEEALQLFEPFYTTKQGGLGLGLSISRSIIEAHGGKLLAFPNPIGGAIFFFTIPAAKGRAG